MGMARSGRIYLAAGSNFVRLLLVHARPQPSPVLLPPEPSPPSLWGLWAQPFFTYVHVGKTGGTALVEAFKKVCTFDHVGHITHAASHLRMVQMRLTRNTTATTCSGHNVHMRATRAWECRRPTFLCLITVRDPIDRIVSAFNFLRDGDPLAWNQSAVLSRFFSCFRTVDQFAKALSHNWEQLPASMANASVCVDVAHRVLQGGLGGHHLSAGYHFYTHAFLNDGQARWLTIRQEHMGEGFACAISHLLGRTVSALELPALHIVNSHEQARYLPSIAQRHLKASDSPDTKLSESNRRSLLHALAEEYAVYHYLLNHSIGCG